MMHPVLNESILRIERALYAKERPRRSFKRGDLLAPGSVQYKMDGMTAMGMIKRLGVRKLMEASSAGNTKVRFRRKDNDEMGHL